MKDKLLNLLKDNKANDNFMVCVLDNEQNDIVSDIYIDGENNLVLFTGENDIIYKCYYISDLKGIPLKNIKSVYVDCNEYIPVKEIKILDKKVLFEI